MAQYIGLSDGYLQLLNILAAPNNVTNFSADLRAADRKPCNNMSGFQKRELYILAGSFYAEKCRIPEREGGIRHEARLYQD
jgi:hypothetical protein